MASEILAPYLDPGMIMFFVDQDKHKQGGTCLGRPIKPPSAILEQPGSTVLINSIEYEAAIKDQLVSEFSAAVANVLPISKLLADIIT